MSLTPTVVLTAFASLGVAIREAEDLHSAALNEERSYEAMEEYLVAIEKLLTEALKRTSTLLGIKAVSSVSNVVEHAASGGKIVVLNVTYCECGNPMTHHKVDATGEVDGHVYICPICC